jgi:nucleoid-associated protein YgaU
VIPLFLPFMRSSPFRLALTLALLPALALFGRLAAAEAEPAPAAPETPAPAAVPDQDTAEAKLAVALRSYTLLRDENDQLKADQEKNATEKAALEAQLAVTKSALPVAAQAAGLREQLRQTQDQLAALELENNQLKTQLAFSAPAPGTVMSEPLHPSSVAVTPAPAPTPVAALAPRIHVVTAGEPLGQISRQYYGTSSRWPEILAANRDVLRDEKSLVVGCKLRIP